MSLSPKATIAIIKKTKANQTQIGAVFLAMIGNITDNGPRYVPYWEDAFIQTSSRVVPCDGATIQDDGIVTAHFQTKGGAWLLNMAVAPIREIRNDFRRLADRLSLDDADRIALMDLLRHWIRKDLRKDVGHDE